METDELRIKCIDDRKPHQHNLHFGEGGWGERIAPMGKVSNVNSLETTRTQKVLISAFKLMLKTFPAEFRSVDNSLFRSELTFFICSRVAVASNFSRAHSSGRKFSIWKQIVN